MCSDLVQNPHFVCGRGLRYDTAARNREEKVTKEKEAAKKPKLSLRSLDAVCRDLPARGMRPLTSLFSSHIDLDKVGGRANV